MAGVEGFPTKKNLSAESYQQMRFQGRSVSQSELTRLKLL